MEKEEMSRIGSNILALVKSAEDQLDSAARAWDVAGLLPHVDSELVEGLLELRERRHTDTEEELKWMRENGVSLHPRPYLHAVAEVEGYEIKMGISRRYIEVSGHPLSRNGRFLHPMAVDVTLLANRGRIREAITVLSRAIKEDWV